MPFRSGEGHPLAPLHTQYSPVTHLPFDPSKMTGTSRASGDDPMSVSALAGRIADAITGAFPRRVRVRGEVSDPRERTHLYFTLKDATATVQAVMWQSALRRAHERPEHGHEVIASGRVEYYAPSGRVTFIVESVEAVGEGELQLRFKRLADELRGLGWFNPATKRALPAFPQRVAIVTSPASAGLQDVIDTARRRGAGVEILVAGVRVQGEGSAGEVARAIRRLSAARARLGIDAIIVTRGGGSLEDLWAFNERIVAEAIHACEVPIVAAIGHETDTTIAELVADERAATPTQAAMRVVPDGAALARQVDATRRRLRSDARRTLQHASEQARRARAHLREARSTALARAARRVETAATRLERANPAALHARRSERLTALASRLRTSMAHALARAESRCANNGRRIQDVVDRSLERALSREAAAVGRLAAVGPQAVLERGFTCTFDAKGRVVRDPSGVRAGDPLTTRTAGGDIASRVEGAGGESAWRLAPARRRRRKGDDDASQMDLFAGGG